MAATYTLADFVMQLRALLLDAVPAYLWPDDPLKAAVISGITEHSFLFPRYTRMTYDVGVNQQEFDLAALGAETGPSNPGWDDSVGIIDVVGVELPPGRPLPTDDW